LARAKKGIFPAFSYYNVINNNASHIKGVNSGGKRIKN